MILISLINYLGAKTLQPLGRYLGNCDKREELLLGILFVISLTGDAHAYTPGDTSDSLAPYLLVQFHIDSDISGPHCLLGKLTDLLQGIWCLLLEGTGYSKYNIIR